MNDGFERSTSGFYVPPRFIAIGRLLVGANSKQHGGRYEIYIFGY